VRIIWVTAAFVLIASLVVSLFALYLGDPLFLRAPNDESIINLFREHHGELSQLQRMASDDGVGYLSASHLDGISNMKRKQEYASLLAQIRPGLIVARSNHSTRFILASGGLSAIGPGWMKGIEHFDEGFQPTGIPSQELDRPSTLPIGAVSIRKIDSNWFIVFQRLE
jgi:hypothetical protein